MYDDINVKMGTPAFDDWHAKQLIDMCFSVINYEGRNLVAVRYDANHLRMWEAGRTESLVYPNISTVGPRLKVRSYIWVMAFPSFICGAQTIVHEMAHHLDPELELLFFNRFMDGHGPSWKRTYVALLQVIMPTVPEVAMCCDVHSGHGYEPERILLEMGVKSE